MNGKLSKFLNKINLVVTRESGAVTDWMHLKVNVKLCTWSTSHLATMDHSHHTVHIDKGWLPGLTTVETFSFNVTVGVNYVWLAAVCWLHDSKNSLMYVEILWTLFWYVGLTFLCILTRRLCAESEREIRLQYQRTVRHSTDPYKRCVNYAVRMLQRRRVHEMNVDACHFTCTTILYSTGYVSSIRSSAYRAAAMCLARIIARAFCFD